jgi:hypothetical protein
MGDIFVFGGEDGEKLMGCRSVTEEQDANILYRGKAAGHSLILFMQAGSASMTEGSIKSYHLLLHCSWSLRLKGPTSASASLPVYKEAELAIAGSRQSTFVSQPVRNKLASEIQIPFSFSGEKKRWHGKRQRAAPGTEKEEAGLGKKRKVMDGHRSLQGEMERVMTHWHDIGSDNGTAEDCSSEGRESEAILSVGKDIFIIFRVS